MLEQMISNKAGWTRVAFGDVVRKVRDKVDPWKSGLERYVAGEHLDTNDLRIRRWGLIGDDYLGPAFHMRFKPGHVLYGSRRTYLRKVALADFEGITANTTYVLEAKDPKVLMPELLPFIMQTEAFHAHSIARSKGSVNPYVNFSDIACFEFLLPPIQEQVRIVEALTAAVSIQKELYTSLGALSVMNASVLEYRMRGLGLEGQTWHERVGQFRDSWPLLPLGEILASVQYGLSEEAGSVGQYPMIRMMNLEHGQVVENDLKFVDLNKDEFQRYQLDGGDVLFNRTNSYDLVGRTGVYSLKGDHVFASYLVRLKTKSDQLHPDYLCAFLNAPIGRRQVMSFATRGVSQTNVNASNLKRILVPLPPLGFQRRTVEVIHANRSASERISNRISFVGRMISRVIAQGISA